MAAACGSGTTSIARFTSISIRGNAPVITGFGFGLGKENKKMIIGLCGKPDAGKTTIAKHFVEKFGFAHINVGDPIKWMLGAFYCGLGLDQAEIARRLTGDLKETPDPYLCGQPPRLVMQVIGKEGRDPIDPMLFAHAWELRLPKNGDVIADGMR